MYNGDRYSFSVLKLENQFTTASKSNKCEVSCPMVKPHSHVEPWINAYVNKYSSYTNFG